MKHIYQAASDAAAVFERCGVPYVMSGGVASIRFGEPRSTMDVDFAVHMEAHQLERLHSLTEGTFALDLESARHAVSSNSMFQMIHLAEFVKVDVHVRPRRGLDEQQIARGRWTRLGSGFPDEIRVATPEDVLLQKLLWYRAGDENSTTQWRDVVGLLKARAHAMDWQYLERWARDASVGDLLQRAAQEAGIPRGGA